MISVADDGIVQGDEQPLTGAGGLQRFELLGKAQGYTTVTFVYARSWETEEKPVYQLVYDLNHGMPDPTGMGPKTIAETRTGRALADPMIFLNMTSVMRRVDPEQAALYDRVRPRHLCVSPQAGDEMHAGECGREWRVPGRLHRRTCGEPRA